MSSPGCGKGGLGMYLVVISELDPVAQGAAELWGTLPATGDRLDGVPIRRLSEEVLVVRRAGRHIHDERLDRNLPASVRSLWPTLVFPSIHRSAKNIPGMTVHALGNPGPAADLGGRPGTLVPTDPRSATAVLRALAERAPAVGLPVSYEATHHGPELDLPAFFVEIGSGEVSDPPPEPVRVLAGCLTSIVPDARDRVVLGVGGGHYAPHFSELALRRRWAFGHILSRHAHEGLTREVAHAAWEQTPHAEGILYARARDAGLPALTGLGERRRDTEAPLRQSSEGAATTTRGARPSGT